MKKIGKDEILMNFLSEQISLTSSKLYKIDILLKDQGLLIDLYFEFIRSKDHIRLSFSGIKEYSFYYNSDFIFYNVEIVKFFRSEKGIYISLDPVDEDEYISKDDQDYILSNSVEGFIIN